MDIIKWIMIATGVAITLWLLDRLGLYMEKKGWIYYRYKKASPGTTASALLELHSILEPSKKHLVEQHYMKKLEVDENGDPVIPEFIRKRPNADERSDQP